MIGDNNDGWGDNWDMGGEIISDIIAYPLKEYIKSECEKQGIDIHNPERIIATSVASAVVSSFLGTLLGGPVGFLTGIMLYGVGMTASYPSDRARPRTSHMKTKEAIVLQAGRVATAALKAKISQSTWEKICDEVQKTIAPYLEGKLPEPPPAKCLQIIYDAMSSVSPNAAKQWATVIYIGLKELDIDI